MKSRLAVPARLGRFTMTVSALTQNTAEAYAIFDDCLPVRTLSMSQGIQQCVVIHPYFDEVKPGDEIPEYEPVVRGGVREWNRIGGPVPHDLPRGRPVLSVAVETWDGGGGGSRCSTDAKNVPFIASFQKAWTTMSGPPQSARTTSGPYDYAPSGAQDLDAYDAQQKAAQYSAEIEARALKADRKLNDDLHALNGIIVPLEPGALI